MTPERERYFAGCSDREMSLRHLIKYFKLEFIKAKAMCSSYDLKCLGREPLGYRVNIVAVRDIKLTLQSLRHELARLKGMDRVVRPRKAYRGYWGDMGGLCKCEAHITDQSTFCRRCGRRVLWDKVVIVND